MSNFLVPNAAYTRISADATGLPKFPTTFKFENFSISDFSFVSIWEPKNSLNESATTPADNESVKTIIDSGESGNDFIQSDPSKMAKYNRFGFHKPTLFFDGQNDSYNISNGSLNNFDFGIGDLVIFAVVERDPDAKARNIIEKYELNGGNEDGFLLNINSAGLAGFECSDGSGTRSYVVGSTIIDDGAPHLITGVRDSVSGISVRVDGVIESLTASANTGTILNVDNSFDLELADGSDPGIEGDFWADNIGGIYVRNSTDAIPIIEKIIMNQFGI